VGGGDDDRTTANCGSGTAPDELLTSSRISSLSLAHSLLSWANWGKEFQDRDAQSELTVAPPDR
jgi:hypothetical protein